MPIFEDLPQLAMQDPLRRLSGDGKDVFAVMFRSLEVIPGASLSLSESMSIMSASESSGSSGRLRDGMPIFEDLPQLAMQDPLRRLSGDGKENFSVAVMKYGIVCLR
jgi:hypothetical protein